jgi:hypoxanthine-guanine phosphoribosyltransferase
MRRIAEIALEEKWARLKESLGDEILTDAYSDEEIDELIREAGADPEAIDRKSNEQARELWNRWKAPIADKITPRGAAAQSNTSTAQVRAFHRDDNSLSQCELTLGDNNKNSDLAPEIGTVVDRYRQREQLVRTILENAGAIERECDYALPCKLHCGTHINIGKICRSEAFLASIASALDEALGDEAFDTFVSTSWALAMIARRLVSKRAERRLNIRHVMMEGYDPNVLEEIKPDAKVILLLDVVVTGGQLLRVTQELQRQKAASVKAITIVDADFAGKCTSIQFERLCRISLDLAEPSECNRCGRLPLAEFNPIAGRMTKKKPPRSPSQFLEQDPVARELWDFVNIAGAFEHHRIIGNRHYVGFVDTVRLLHHPTTQVQIVKKFCERITEHCGVPNVVLVPKRVRGELVGKCLVTGFKQFLGISGIRLECARQKRGHFILDGLSKLSGMHVLVADAAAGHGDTLDELTLISLLAGAGSVSGAVLLSRLSEACEKAFDERLSGRFVRLYSMPVRPITVRDNNQMTCPVCQRRQDLREAIGAFPNGPVREVAKKLLPARRFRSPARAVRARQMTLFPQDPLEACRPAIASGIALHALHAAMNDGMAPLILPEIGSSEYSSAKRAALVADLPAGTLKWSGQPLTDQLCEFLRTGSDRAVWMAIVDFMYRSRSPDWVDCLGDAIKNSANEWMDNDFWARMVLVVYRLVHDRPEIGDQIKPVLQTLAQTYDNHPAHEGLQGMVTAISEVK